MPKILIHSATAGEISPLMDFLKPFETQKKGQFRLPNCEIRLCISGAGMVNCAFELGKLAGENFDLALQAGIAGSFGEFRIGEVLRIEQDCFSEMGAEDGENFLSLDELELGQQTQIIQFPYRHPFLKKLPLAKGITVNRVHGDEKSIKNILQSHQPDIESMEGAAFIYAANACGWPALQLRAISNKVERRRRDHWNIPLAVKQLNQVLLELIRVLDEN